MEESEFKKAIDYLEKCEKVYTQIGSAGYWALTFTIRPLRDRLNSGERTEELYKEIMEISL